jgi:hypothetical protein
MGLMIDRVALSQISVRVLMFLPVNLRPTKCSILISHPGKVQIGNMSPLITQTSDFMQSTDKCEYCESDLHCLLHVFQYLFSQYPSNRYTVDHILCCWNTDRTYSVRHKREEWNLQNRHFIHTNIVFRLGWWIGPLRRPVYSGDARRDLGMSSLEAFVMFVRY